jgi:hypothetical protein
MINWNSLAIVVGLVLFSCSNTQRDSETTASQLDLKNPYDSLSFNELLSLPDSLYALKDIKSTIELYEKLQKLKFVSLDSLQKLRIVATCPGLDTYPGLGTYWIMNDWRVSFIAKQKEVEGLTPIIVAVGGTDFGALILIVLDKENHPKSYRILSGGECSDPFCDIINSTFTDGKIVSYKISCKSEPQDRYATVDSISYLSTILTSGQIQTTRTDSSRYVRLFK